MGAYERVTLPAEAFVVGVAARMVAQKGLGFLLEALHQLRARCPTLHVALAGSGVVEQELRDQAAALALEDRVHFLGLRRDVPAVLQILDAYVLPSLSEGLPMGLLEAMAAARPIVATTSGGVGAAVEHEVSGLLVEPGQADQLASAFERFVEQPEFARQMGAAAERTFEEFFSAETMARRYESLYLRSA